MKIDLYLDGNIVEINKDIDFVLNKQFTDLSDLTSIIVDYSKTIKVPMTAHNNELFNYTYKLDRQVLINDEIISYDPSQKIPMTMQFNGSTVMDGYAVLNNVNLKDRTYEINIYGQLGKIFYEMKEKPLKNYKQVDNGFWKSIRMNTKNIKDSFTNDRRWPDTDGWTSGDWTDFWGFAPQLMGKTDDIDTKSYEVRNATEANRIKNFADDINTARSITYGDLYVGDGFDINQYAEVRTYMTRPYVYVDKLIKLVQNEINTGDYDGYTMNLDPDWFEWYNPYYWNLCYFPGNESLVEQGDSYNGLVTWNHNAINDITFPSNLKYVTNPISVDLEGYTYTTNPNNGEVSINSSTPGEEVTATLTLNCDNIVLTDIIEGVGSTIGFNDNGTWGFYNLDDPFVVPIRYIGIYDGLDRLIYKLYLCDNTIYSIHEESSFLDYIYQKNKIENVWDLLRSLDPRYLTPNSTTWVNHSSLNTYCSVDQTYNFGNIVLSTNEFRFKMGCDMIGLAYYNLGIVEENISYSNYKTLCPFKNNYNTKVWDSGATLEIELKPIQTLSVSSNNYRSGALWTIFDVLGNDFNPFTWLMNYVKMFRLYFDIDYLNKTITLKSGYFDTVTYKQVDVDYSKDVIIEPLIDKYKKVNFSYKENGSRKGNRYYKNYGVQYGDMDIITPINLNNDTLSLNPDPEMGVFIPTNCDALTWTTLVTSGSNLVYTSLLGTDQIINTLNSGNEIEYFPFFAFRWVNSNNGIWLSDDTPTQKNTGKYVYLDRNSGWDTEVETIEGSTNIYYLQYCVDIPQFDNYYCVDGEDDEYNYYRYIYWITFGIPKEIYNGGINNSGWDIVEQSSVYNRWGDYLNEIFFNVNNKKVTCYIKMSYPDYLNFKFNQLFVIDNNTFLVNKIIDFNPNSQESTKVELIQISDVDSLKTVVPDHIPTIT